MYYKSFYWLEIVHWYENSRRLYGHLNLIYEQAMFSVPTDKVSTFKQFLPKSVFELILEIHRF